MAESSDSLRRTDIVKEYELSVSRNDLAEKLNLDESEIKCMNCINSKDNNRGMWWCDIWKGRVYEFDFCSSFDKKSVRKREQNNDNQ